MKQLSLNSQMFRRPPTQFGGELLLKKRKSKRPLNTKLPLHIVLRADINRSGSLLRHRFFLKKTLSTYALKFNVKIYETAVVQNHIHLVVKFCTRENYKSFVRALSGVLAKKLLVKWQLRPFSRIVKWGKDLKNVVNYVIQNTLEATGAIPYSPRKKTKVRQI